MNKIRITKEIEYSGYTFTQEYLDGAFKLILAILEADKRRKAKRGAIVEGKAS
jgi:hypothetical protein